MARVRKNIEAMHAYVPGEQPTDPTVVKLNTNENPYPPSLKVLEAIRAVTADALRRYPHPDAQAFRQAAAQIHGVPPEMIFPTNGGDELLACAVRTCAGEGDRVAFLDPSYSLYPLLAAMQAATPVVLPYNDDWSLPKNIESADAAILLLVNPNAPSGTFEPADRLRAIAKKFRGVLLIDEAYVDFAPSNALALASEFDHVLILRTLSKGYSLAGLRFGYGIASPKLLAELRKVRDSYPCDAVAIAAATAAIKDQEYARGTWEKVKSERARLSAELRQLGFSLPESHSNFVLAQAPKDAKTLYEKLKARNILVRYFNLPRLTDKLRITVGTAEQNDTLLKELKSLVLRP
jgi:histidinol-phosphate aminotransferase